MEIYFKDNIKNWHKVEVAFNDTQLQKLDNLSQEDLESLDSKEKEKLIPKYSEVFANNEINKKLSEKVNDLIKDVENYHITALL